MKITIVHGQDLTQSRARFLQIINAIKKRGWELIKIQDNESGVAEKLNANSLFGTQILYTCEDVGLFSQLDFDWMKKEQTKKINLLVWHKGELGKRVLAAFPRETRTEVFNLPKTIFVFLESLRPGNSQQSLTLLKKLLEKEKPEFVFALLTRHLRDLYWLQQEPESLKLPTWRLSKLKKQAVNFKPEELKRIIRALGRIDIATKTGGGEINFWLDLFVVKELESRSL